MEKVLITMLTGEKMLFPTQYAKKVMKRNELATKAYALQKVLVKVHQANKTCIELDNELRETMDKIVRLNRQIPPCGEVV